VAARNDESLRVYVLAKLLVALLRLVMGNPIR
jgi:hypothetical protein